MDIAVMLYVLQVLWTVGGGLFSRSKTAQFEVHVLPDSPSLPTSWAGRLPVPGTKDGNALFFWLFQTEDPAYDDNLISEFCLKKRNESTLMVQSGLMADLDVRP
jgi:hypothetical protein